MKFFPAGFLFFIGLVFNFSFSEITYTVIDEADNSMPMRQRKRVQIVAEIDLTSEQRTAVMKQAALDLVQGFDVIKVSLMPFDSNDNSLQILGTITYAPDKCSMQGAPSGCIDSEWSNGEISDLALTAKQIDILKDVYIAYRMPKFIKNDGDPKTKELNLFVSKKHNVTPKFVEDTKNALHFSTNFKKIE